MVRQAFEERMGFFYDFVLEQAVNDFSSNQPFGIALFCYQPSGGMTNPYSDTGNPFPVHPAPNAAGERNVSISNAPGSHYVGPIFPGWPCRAMESQHSTTSVCLGIHNRLYRQRWRTSLSHY